MPPFWPPQILLRRIFGLLPVLEKDGERLEEGGKRGGALRQPSLPDLNPRVHVVVDVVVFQHAVSVVIEIHANLEETRSPVKGVDLTSDLLRLPPTGTGSLTCLPLWMRFLRRTGVLPVVTHTPASVLL